MRIKADPIANKHNETCGFQESDKIYTSMRYFVNSIPLNRHTLSLGRLHRFLTISFNRSGM